MEEDIFQNFGKHEYLFYALVLKGIYYFFYSRYTNRVSHNLQFLEFQNADLT